VAHPDSTSVTNEYFQGGLLKKTSGSRTYPVEYTYHSQGRMKTMKTWKNFSGNSGAATTTWNYHFFNQRFSFLSTIERGLAKRARDRAISFSERGEGEATRLRAHPLLIAPFNPTRRFTLLPPSHSLPKLRAFTS
jgi:hypothetical protein